MIGEVSRETYEKLLLFENRFLKWNKRINLASETSVKDLWRRHIVDSAQIWRLGRGAKKWLDIGTGGGFPGAVLAILLSEIADAEVHLVESNAKKAAFLSQVMGETGAPATVHVCRIQELHGELGEIEVVTARAVAGLRHLLSMARPWLNEGARALFQKGRDYRAEIMECRDNWTYDLLTHESGTDPGGVVLEISGLRPGKS